MLFSTFATDPEPFGFLQLTLRTLNFGTLNPLALLLLPPTLNLLGFYSLLSELLILALNPKTQFAKYCSLPHFTNGHYINELKRGQLEGKSAP